MKQKNQKFKAGKSNLENYLIKRSACQAVRPAGSTPGTLPLIDFVVFNVIDLMPELLHIAGRFISNYASGNTQQLTRRFLFA